MIDCFTGDDSLATELRLRTVIELMANFDWYMNEHQHDAFERLCGVSFDEDVRECAVNGGSVSIWAIAGLATVIRRSIVSVYPAVNGTNDPVATILNRTLRPRVSDGSRSAIFIMWTHSVHHVPGTHWIPNHFVPLVPVRFYIYYIINNSNNSNITNF